jgi:hypothetical protein
VKEKRRNCLVCSEQIAVDAKKCSHCGSFQGWRAYLSHGHTTLALLIALVSAVSVLIPIITKALRPDDSEINITYIDRVDTTIPLIASNHGNRPGVMSAGAILRIVTGRQGDAADRDHILIATAMAGTRDDLLVPENSSKQFFFVVDSRQDIPDQMQELSTDLHDINSLKQCTVLVTYQDFSGKQEKIELPIFGAGAKRRFTEMGEVGHILDAEECIGKIPEDLREKYKLEFLK